MEIDNKTLTLFLIDCMTQVFEHKVVTVDKPLVPGTIQRGLKKDDLRYLEIISGTTRTSRVEILVYSEGTHGPIFGMNIVSRLDIEKIQKNSLVYTDVLDVLRTARLNGFKQTREKIIAQMPFSLFDIPDHHEPVPVSKGGRPGMLRYEETIDDTLDFFGGSEEIYSCPDSRGPQSSLVFQSNVQGCCII